MKYDIVSIGAATVDIFARSVQLAIRPDLVGFAPSSKNEISDSLITSGGGATNSAVSFSRLGLKTSCLALLGTEPLSHYVISDLQNNQVPTSLLRRSRQESTDFSIILVAPDGSRSVLTQRGTTRLCETDIPWNDLKKTPWLYITSLEGNIDLLETLVGFARENNIKISLNPGRRELQNRHRLLPLLPQIDFLLLNKTESQELLTLDASDLSFWTKLSTVGPKIISVTYGRQGAYVITSAEKYYSPVMNVNPVDETGAGDSFGSAFVAGLIHGLAPSECLTWGIKNSASTVSFLGSKPGLLTYSQITTPDVT